MISHDLIRRKDVHKTVQYYQHGKDDYYASEGEAMAWQGKGAKRLNLSGQVDPKRFKELLHGNVSKTQNGTRKFTRKNSRDRLAIDFTFSPPKSVSLQALIGGDMEIIKAHDHAVAHTLQEMECYAQTRKKHQGQSALETTGSLIIAKFRHETSRELDPQLHTHCVVMNLTQRKDGAWRALHNDKLIKNKSYFDTLYLSKLAHELQKLGYVLRHDPNGAFELAHITRDQVEYFSARSQQIVKELETQGLTRKTASYQDKQMATLKTRKTKVRIERDRLYDSWAHHGKELGICFKPERVQARQDYFATLPAQEAARRSVRYAITHLTERQSIIRQTDLIMTALKQSMGVARVEEITEQIIKQHRSGFLIKGDVLYKEMSKDVCHSDKCMSKQAWVAEAMQSGLSRKAAKAYITDAIAKGRLTPTETFYTTQTALEREQRILKIEQEGRGAVAPVMSKTKAKLCLVRTSLNESQSAAAAHILTTPNRVIGVQGSAGVGKSFMLEAAKTAMEAEGYHLLALAPYGSQVRELKKLGTSAKTVAGFLKTKNKDIDQQTVLVVDEAGVLPTRLMEQLLKTAEAAGARLVLLGDTAQTKAIEAGRPFYDLQSHGMSTTYMRNILRQKNKQLKTVAQYAANGKTSASLNAMNHKDLIEIEDASERHSAIADAYLALTEDERTNTLIVSGTNAARREINTQIRDGLGLAGTGKTYTLLIRRDTTEAERRHAKNFHVGDVIIPQKDYHNGLKRYEPYEILENGPGNRLTVKSQDGEKISFSPSAIRKLSVFQAEQHDLAVGDRVRATAKHPSLDIETGERFEVTEITTNAITLANNKRDVTLPSHNPLQLDHAYATTAHSAQGMTKDRAFIDINTKSLTTSKETYYVAVTRARHHAKIFTNDLKALPNSIARETEKFAAMEIVHKHKAKTHHHTHEYDRV